MKRKEKNEIYRKWNNIAKTAFFSGKCFHAGLKPDGSSGIYEIFVEDDDISVNEIGVGSIIKIKDIELDEIEDLQIVGSTESDPDNGKISDESPIGKAALKHKVGDIFEAETPAGLLKFEVIDISK